jgi:hypothetical protein
MRVRATLSLLVLALLPGCTLFGGSESTAEPDLEDYSGGSGIALVLRNNASDPFGYTLLVLAAGNREVANLNGTIQPGETIEKWWSLERTTYSARLDYTWSAAGSASHGQDDHTVDLEACPTVTRLVWSLEQMEGQVGSSLNATGCASRAEAV